MSENKPKQMAPSFVLQKQRSWSPDINRDEEWSRLKRNQQRRSRRRSKSVTDDDLNELKACVDLGFGFDTPDLEYSKLSSTFPALKLYCAVNRLSRSSSLTSTTESTSPSSLSDFFDPSDGPEMMKTRLRQWAQVVACSVHEASQTKLLETVAKS